ncbi:MAG: rane protein [Chitinophagaceae bacterium]|nr:rane protein [Chitinophagaceae bacterium]
MTPTNTLQNIARIALGAMLCFTGTGHLTWARTAFIAQVPQWLPLSTDFVVVASGVVEILLGLSLIVWTKQRIAIGWLAALFFILVFPGNISQYVNHTDAFGLDTDTRRLVRLFFQPVLVAWAVWSTGAWMSWYKKQSL